MAVVGPLGLLKTIRELKLADIAAQAERTPRLVLYGTPEERQFLRSLLRDGSEDALDLARLEKAIYDVEPTAEEEGAAASLPDAQALFTTKPPSPSLLRLRLPVFQVTDEASLKSAAVRLAAQQGEWVIALGRHVPALRAAVAERLTGETAAVNAEIALISALPGIAPVTQILLPPAAVADIVLLTKNQVMLVLKLAAVYGRALEVTQRLWELAPTIGSAFGWRQLARELVGAVPGGVGVIAKATVAYAGTYTIGRAAQFYYTQGFRFPAAEERRTYAEALARAREAVAGMWSRVRGEAHSATPGNDDEGEANVGDR
ncbi:MAG: hypothetical protein QHJ73_02945 [Armatimonadota bacterium]|nr:hypothetical protein [Armatimonadota bacterium]